MVVHLCGQMAPMKQICDLVRRQTAGAGRCCSSLVQKSMASVPAVGHVGFSFYPANIGALGDGGAMTTNDDALAETVRLLANMAAQKMLLRCRDQYAGRNPGGFWM